jgi:hypothetical protein
MFACWTPTHRQARQNGWQGNKDSNLGMPESKSGALTNLAIPLHDLLLAVAANDHRQLQQQAKFYSTTR